MLPNVHTHHSKLADSEVFNQQGIAEKKKFFSSGRHPWLLFTDKDLNIEQLKEELIQEGCVALGECGLDRVKGPALEEQIAIFREQVHLSEELKLPMIIHCVRAWNELRELKRELSPSMPWIWHGFNKPQLIREVIEEGIYLSLGEELLHNTKLQSALKEVPIQKILIETDESPVPVKQLYVCLSELKKIPLPALTSEIQNTIKRIFPKWTTGLNAPSC